MAVCGIFLFTVSVTRLCISQQSSTPKHKNVALEQLCGKTKGLGSYNTYCPDEWLVILPKGWLDMLGRRVASHMVRGWPGILVRSVASLMDQGSARNAGQNVWPVKWTKVWPGMLVRSVASHMGQGLARYVGQK